MPTDEHHPQGNRPALVLGALGVVYGDIGTSPLYAMSGIFDTSHGGIAGTEENARGFVSLVVWALTVVVALKYLVFVLRADNDGEGGVFALYSLVHHHRRAKLAALLSILMLAAGLLFGDGIITPAISVLSAVEGLTVVTPMFEHAAVPITLVVLTVLFGIQSSGTARVGRVFGPVVVVWFASIAVLGVVHILRHPSILAAVDPRYGARFLVHGGARASLGVLGAVILTVTGGEALYADMGHFGKAPIRTSWFSVVFPALLLNYLGQGAYLASGAPVTGANIFFSMVPKVALVPMVILATLATVIASQALISGAFSLAAQAVALGLFPRLRIIHTHHAHEGQIYLPFINWVLYLGCVLLVVGFKSSAALASAYGLAVSGVMLATSLAMIPVAELEWGWSALRARSLFGLFAAVDAAFLLANSTKFLDGGAIPLAVGVVTFAVMRTWKWGRKATFAAYSGKHTMTMKELVALKETGDRFLERNAVVMVPKPLRSESDNTPALLQLLWDRYGVLPKNLIFVEVVHKKVPYVRDRYHVTVFQRSPEKGCIASVTISFGFMEDPDVERVLEDLAGHHAIDLPKNPELWNVHVSVENLLPAHKRPALWRVVRQQLFAGLRHLSQPAYYYYGLGNNVHLSSEIVPVRLG
jgi:KUP system potassium uptake protein